MRNDTKRVLIYRLGSLGDTIVALPLFHLIAETYPHSERYVLTNFISNTKASHTSIILDGSGLVHGYLSYPIGLRDPFHLVRLRRQIKKLRPEILVYLAAPRGRLKAFRDAAFFKACGIKQLIGVPYTNDLQHNRWLPGQKCFEPEVSRLARCLSGIGDAQLDNPGSWDLKLTHQEIGHADELLLKFGRNPRIIACALGTKADANHWGLENWQKLLGQLCQHYKDHVLMFVGAEDEVNECEEAGHFWLGDKINLCGMLTPRESAAVLQRAAVFIGHDSGPMHLAASVDTRCVAIFSARNRPGVWFPYGNAHKVIYHQTECYGCGLEICADKGKKCIKSITVEETLSASVSILGHG